MKVDNIRSMVKNRVNRAEVYSTAEYWDAKARELEGDAVSMWPNNELNRLYHREQLTVIDKYLPDVKGLHILDVGCGTGRVTRYLAERGADMTGLDFSAQAIAIAKRLSPQGNPQYRVQSIFEIEDAGLYDAAISWGSLAVACKNREELRSALTRLNRTLRPDGKMLLLEPIHTGFLRRVLDMDIKTFCAVAREANFKVRGVTNLHFWPVRLALAYFSLPKPITVGLYNAGHRLMALFGNRMLGDYKAVFATVERTH